MTEPTFLIPGASRSGTSSLYYYLQNHPDIYMSDPKELRFFDCNENYNRGLNYYEQYFIPGEDAAARGEVSPPYWYRGITFDTDRNYQWTPQDDVASRVHESYPDIKLVFTLRNPVTRAYSQYWKNVRQNRERSPSFKDAIQRELNGERDKTNSGCCWIYKNKYPIHLKRWLELFDREQILFFVFEKWIDNPERVLNVICDFIGVNPLEKWGHTDQIKNKARVPRSRWVNRIICDYLDLPGVRQVNNLANMTEGYPEMPTDTEKYLFQEFEPIISETESIIGQNLNVWRL